MIVVLLGAFVAQTFLVYADDEGSVVLEGPSLAGRQVWLENNCQACHQLHGFGGFLGPDLTNASSRFDRDHLMVQLADGNQQMPSFELDMQQIDELWSFLVAMDNTGVGQFRLTSSNDSPGFASDPISDSVSAVLEEAGGPSERAGYELYRSGTCVACHVIPGISSVGAPDLSLAASRLSEKEIRTVLRDGRVPRMPASNLGDDQIQSMIAFLVFLSENRETVLDRAEQSQESIWTSLPWWEYE